MFSLVVKKIKIDECLAVTGKKVDYLLCPVRLAMILCKDKELAS